jgi:sugar phosphate isomerase/epimerase
MVIRVKIDDQEHDIDTDKITSISEADLTKCIVEQPSLYAWVATAHAVYESEADRLDEALKDKEHALYAHYKELAEAKNEKVTERLLTARILASEEYLTLRERYFAVDEKRRKLKGVVFAMEHRKDMLVQLSALKRGEMKLDAMQM